MMKHFVNLSLLLFFLTLVLSGLLRFFQPFDLVTTRIHIAFGFGTLILVGLHLSSRGKYFLNLLKSKRSARKKEPRRTALILITVLTWGWLLIAAYWDWPLVDWLVSASYESRHAKEIFRGHSQTAFKPVESGLQVKRNTDRAASIYFELEWGPEFKPLQENGQPLGSHYPQLAIWAETEDGAILETLFVSQACAMAEKFEWDGTLQSRDEVLPFWYSRYKTIMGREPELAVDGVSSATPIRDFSMEGYLNSDAQPFAIYVEVNAPNDKNMTFHDDQPETSAGFTATGIGQPSVVYEAFVFPEEQKRYFLLELTCHSGGDFKNTNELSYDLESLTTAKALIEKIIVKVVWPDKVVAN